MISLAQAESNPELAHDVISSFISQSRNTYIGNSKDYGIAVKEFFRANPNFTGEEDLLPGLDALVMMTAMLTTHYPQPLIFAYNLFADNDLLDSVLDKAYKANPKQAFNLTRTLLEEMSRHPLYDLYAAQVQQYINVKDKINEKNKALIKRYEAEFNNSQRIEEAPVFGSSASAIEQVEVLSIRSSDHAPRTDLVEAPKQAGSSSLPSIRETVGRFDQFLTTELDSIQETFFKQAQKIDTSSFPATLVDIAKGIEEWREVLPATSPLKAKLEEFYYKLPVFNKERTAEEIVQDLVRLVNPYLGTFGDLEPIDIFGSELASLKKAVEDIYGLVWSKREPNYGEVGRRRGEIPDIRGFFESGNSSDSAFRSYLGNLKHKLEAYEKGEVSFESFVGSFIHVYSHRGEPLYDFAHNFIEAYLPEAQRYDESFEVNLESTHNYDDKILAFQNFLARAKMLDQGYFQAANILSSFCSQYLNRELNDQTFVEEINKLTDRQWSGGMANLPIKIQELLAYFLDQVGF